MLNRLKFPRICLPLLLLALALPAYAEKTDVVVLLNGDTITGEIKGLEFGSLRYSTDSMGTINIDWEDIVSITSNQNLQVELPDGSRHFGTLVGAGERFVVRINSSDEDVNLPTQEIVRITPIETSEKIWQSLDGSFSLGLQSQKSSGVTTSNVSADMSYRTRKYLVGLKMNSTMTSQPAEEAKARQSVEGNYQRFRANRWFTDWYSRWESNDELGINARQSAGGAVGRYLVQTNKNQFSLTGGVQAAQTSYTGVDENTTEAEGRIEMRYLRRNLIPETQITFTSVVYPLLEDFSQFRAETDLSFKREFISDLFFNLSVGHSYISNPPTGASSTDYNIITSLGYSF